jgi:RHS repeat-associated protein
VHPDGTKFTNTVNNAQQITAIATPWTDSHHPASLATSITYTPWGAISQLENGCASSGCTELMETYTYNNRLQPWMIQLGTSTNSSSEYCLVYNYFSSWSAPSSCPAASSVPTSGTGNNGNVMGYYYQDNFQTSFSHTASYTYDNVNRLTEAQATGNSAYTQYISYTAGDSSNGQFGNMTLCPTAACTNPDWTFNVNTNQIKSANYTYDAAGNLTADASNSTTHAYQWDAEGRVSKVDPSNNPPTWALTYDALGDPMQWVSPSGTNEFYADISGNMLGASGSYSIAMLGIRPLVVYTTSETWFHHINNLDSRTFMTDHYGTPTQDMVFYPWGDEWLNWGGGGLEFADLPYYDTNLNVDFAEYRVMSNNLGRWHSPDPIPGDPSNPQGWNRYPYVLNNPTGFIDPTGLCPTYQTTNLSVNGQIYQTYSIQGDNDYPCGTPEAESQSNVFALGGGGGGYLMELPMSNLRELLMSLAPTACTGDAAFSAVSPDQATGPGALAPGVYAHETGGVAVNPALFGFPLPGTIKGNEAAQAKLAAASPFYSIYPAGLNFGSMPNAPVPPYRISDVGDRFIRSSVVPRFDIYNFPSKLAANEFGKQTVPTTILTFGGRPCPKGFNGGSQ